MSTPLAPTGYFLRIAAGRVMVRSMGGRREGQAGVDPAYAMHPTLELLAPPLIGLRVHPSLTLNP